MRKSDDQNSSLNIPASIHATISRILDEEDAYIESHPNEQLIDLATGIAKIKKNLHGGSKIQRKALATVRWWA